MPFDLLKIEIFKILNGEKLKLFFASKYLSLEMLQRKRQMNHAVFVRELCRDSRFVNVILYS